MEPLVFDLFRRGLFEDAEGERVRHVVEEEFHRVGVRSFKFYEYTHKNAHTGQPEFTEWRCSRLSATELRQVLTNANIALFYPAGPILKGVSLTWNLLNRMLVALHSEIDDDLYLEAAEFRRIAIVYARLFVTLFDRNIGAYVHDNVDHVPDFLAKYGTIFQFGTSIPEFIHYVSTR